MEYTIVELPERKIIGLSCHVRNNDPECGKQIGELWGQFMQEEVSGSIQEPLFEPYSCFGLYSNYHIEDMEYDTLVGLESTAETAPEGMETLIIPAGKYAQFSVQGDVVQAVVDAWNDIWAMEGFTELRAFTVDFEAYHPSEDMTNTKIDLFVALQ